MKSSLLSSLFIYPSIQYNCKSILLWILLRKLCIAITSYLVEGSFWGKPFVLHAPDQNYDREHLPIAVDTMG